MLLFCFKFNAKSQCHSFHAAKDCLDTWKKLCNLEYCSDMWKKVLFLEVFYSHMGGKLKTLRALLPMLFLGSDDFSWNLIEIKIVVQSNAEE